MKLYALFALLQLLDGLTTLLVMRRGGCESNPLVSWLMAAGPVAGLVIAKAFVLVSAALIAWAGYKRVLRIANAAFIAVVAWNVSVWMRSL